MMDPQQIAEWDALVDSAFALDREHPFLGQTIEPADDTDPLTTASRGNFGHAGRPGHEGGSAPRNSTFLASPKDALADIAAGKAATIAKEDLRSLLKAAEKTGGTPDLVRLTLEGTPLFAGGLNIKRKDMPQIPREHRNSLLTDLKKQGITVTHEKAAPMSLLPTQKEINAARVGGMLAKFESHKKPINDVLISQDNRVLDGHHRWALAVALQTENNDVKMRVIRIGADHREALALLNAYTKAHNIAPEVLQQTDDPAE